MEREDARLGAEAECWACSESSSANADGGVLNGVQEG